jgi:hypothetical protein
MEQENKVEIRPPVKYIEDDFELPYSRRRLKIADIVPSFDKTKQKRVYQETGASPLLIATIRMAVMIIAFVLALLLYTFVNNFIANRQAERFQNTSFSQIEVVDWHIL